MAEAKKIVYHLSQSVRGALRNWQFPSDYRNVFKKSDDTWATPDEVREFLFDCLADGVEVLPIGDCPDFCVKKGCPGHEQ